MGNTSYKNRSVDIPEGSPLFNHRAEQMCISPQKFEQDTSSIFACCAEREGSSYTNKNKNKIHDIIVAQQQRSKKTCNQDGKCRYYPNCKCYDYSYTL